MPATRDTRELISRIGREPQWRSAKVERRAIDTESRTVELAFSSEAAVERWYGREILDHKPGACRIGRLNSAAPLLLNHDPEDQVGVVDSARIDSDRIGRAVVRFSRSPTGEEILQDVVDGIRANVSVGYIVHAIQLDASDETGDTYRVTDWEPVEISMASIPADTSVGVGRTLDVPNPEIPMDLEETKASAPEATETRSDHEASATLPLAIPVNPEAEQIRAVAAHFRCREQGEDHIMLGGSLAEFRQKMRESTTRMAPIPTVPKIEAHIPRAGQLRAFRPELYSGGRREAEEQAYRAGQFLMAALFGRSDAARWCRDHGVELAAPGAGGIGKRVLTGIAPGQTSVLLPDELILPIIDLREQYGIARRVCYVHPMASETASVPRNASGVTAYFVGRESAPTANDPGFDNVNLTAKNVAAETRISNDYAEDSAINLADYIAQEHARAFATKEDNCLFNGDGTSTYGGIVGIRSAILSLAGAIDAASGHDTFAEIDASDLNAVEAALPDIAGINPVWYCSKYALAKLFGRLAQSASGNRKSDLTAGMPQQWDGYDIVTSPTLPKVATDLSDVAMVIFGDLRMGVMFGDRRGMTMLVDPYSLSSYQQTKIVSSERFDIVAHGVGDSSNAGPIVALIGE